MGPVDFEGHKSGPVELPEEKGNAESFRFSRGPGHPRGLQPLGPRGIDGTWRNAIFQL